MSGSGSIHVGCAGFGPGRPVRSYNSLDVVELLQTFIHPPRKATLRRWRAAAPRGLGFVVRAWQLVTHEPSSPSYRQLPKALPAPFSLPVQGTGHLRDNAPVRRALELTLDVAAELHADAILFETPTSFTPTATHRRALTRFFERCPRSEQLLIWQPTGLWNLDEVVAMCRDLKLTPAWDPLIHPEQPVPSRLPSVYLRPLGLGGLRRLGEAQLASLCDRLAGTTTYCVFGAPGLLDEARRLRRMVHDR